MKRGLVLFLVLVIMMTAGCAGAISPKGTIPTTTSVETATPVATATYYVSTIETPATATVPPTATATRTQMPATAVPPTATVPPTVTSVPPTATATATRVPPTSTWTSVPPTATKVSTETPKATPTATQVPTKVPTPVLPANSCTKQGVAWNDSNLESGALYGETPIGGLSEECWVVGQVWTDKPAVRRFVFAVRPHTVAWLSGYRGGTGWWFGGSLDDVRATLQKQVAELEARDGVVTTTVVILPEDASKFQLLTRFKSATTASASTIPPTVTSAPTAVPTTTPAGVAGSCPTTGQPGNVFGPSILEDASDGTLRKIDARGFYYWMGAGSCWAKASQLMLDQDWPVHKKAFLAKWKDARVIE